MYENDMGIKNEKNKRERFLRLRNSRLMNIWIKNTYLPSVFFVWFRPNISCNLCIWPYFFWFNNAMNFASNAWLAPPSLFRFRSWCLFYFIFWGLSTFSYPASWWKKWRPESFSFLVLNKDNKVRFATVPIFFSIVVIIFFSELLNRSTVMLCTQENQDIFWRNSN